MDSAQNYYCYISCSIVNSFEGITPEFIESDSLTNSFSRNMNTFAFSAAKVCSSHFTARQKKMFYHLFFVLQQREVTELFPQDEADLRYVFTRNKDGEIVISSEERSSGNYEASMTFPRSLVEQLSGSPETGLALSYYTNAVMFPYTALNKTEDLPDVTPVVSASFVGHQLKDLKDNVIITLKLENTYDKVSCVSWSFEANGMYLIN